VTTAPNPFTGSNAALAKVLYDELAARLGELPPEIVAAREHLDRVQALRPAGAPGGDITDAYLAEDPTRAHELAVVKGTYAALTTGWQTAVTRLGRRLMNVIEANSLELIDRLGERANPLIGKIHSAAALPADVTDLVRAGRPKDAQLVAGLSYTVTELRALYKLRSKITRGADYGASAGYSCDTYSNPHEIVQAVMSANRNMPVAELIVANVRQGARLWFPNPTEAHARARELAAENAGETAATERSKSTHRTRIRVSA
jgi:hypothetical protein